MRSSPVKFYKELESSLAASTGEQRRMWATTIIEEHIDIKQLAPLLRCEGKTATRFLWLLSDVGILNPERLRAELPFLLELCEREAPAYTISFASYWHYAGVPVENESKAIDLLFQWLLSAGVSVTMKSRALWVLQKLAGKYPELRNELKLCLEEQMDKYSIEFKKRAGKILLELEEQ